MLNKAFLIGRLTADPQVRSTSSGTHVTNLRLATNTYAGKDDDGTRKEHTDFHNLVLFGPKAMTAGTYLRTGWMVFAEGRIQTRSWDAADGSKRYTTEIVVENFKMLEPKHGEERRKQAAPEAEPEPLPEPDSVDDDGAEEAEEAAVA